MKNILWLAPSFNHYKARFLNHLAKEPEINLTILSGTGRKQMGDQELEQEWSFKQDKVSVLKKDFGNSEQVKNYIKAAFNDFDWILIPAEKKNLPLFIFLKKLKRKNPNTKLFSYNHPILKSAGGKTTFIDKLLTKFYYRKLDRVIFYTEHSYHWAIKNKLINVNKAFWANNTLDTLEINKYYQFVFPPKSPITITFIGRLISSKRIEDFFNYYHEIKKEFPAKNLKLEIIGDGPENNKVKAELAHNKDVIWHGTIVDEAKIAPIMMRSQIIFIPGLSGLSINHAFVYGRPYITLQAEKHGPEISYIENNKNGYILDQSFLENAKKISQLLLNREKLEAFCLNAKQKGEELSVENWVKRIKYSLLYEE